MRVNDDGLDTFSFSTYEYRNHVLEMSQQFGEVRRLEAGETKARALEILPGAPRARDRPRSCPKH